MTATPPLLAQDLLLLGYHPASGRPATDSTRLTCGLAGALLADLALADRVSIEDDQVRTTSHEPTGEVELDSLAERIAAERRPRKAKWWVAKIQTSKLRRALLERAVADGVLRHERGTLLLLFPSDKYFAGSIEQRARLQEHLHAVLIGASAPDPRTVALVALVGAVRLDGKLFPGMPAKERRARIKAVIASDAIGQAVRKVIESIEAATAAVVAAGGDGGGGDGGGGGGG